MKFLRKSWTSILVAVAVILLLVALGTALASHKDAKAVPVPFETQGTVIATAVPGPSSTTSTIPATLGGFDNEPQQVDSDSTCDKRIGSSTTTTFQQNVFEYEVLRLSPQSASTFESLKKLATSRYILDHPEDIASSSKPGDDILVTSDMTKSEALCKVQTNGNRLMTVVSVITTSRIVNGQTIIVNSDFETPQHQTIWILEKGIWKVNNE